MELKKVTLVVTDKVASLDENGEVLFNIKNTDIYIRCFVEITIDCVNEIEEDENFDIEPDAENQDSRFEDENENILSIKDVMKKLSMSSDDVEDLLYMAESNAVRIVGNIINTQLGGE